MNRRWITVAVIIIVLVVGGALLSTNHSKSSTTANNSQTNSSQNNQTSTPTITYTANGFSPASTTVKSGSMVTFQNNSSTDIQVDSNPHPIHTDDTDLNVGLISPGQSKTATLTKVGSFGFHNHLDPGQTAKITIQ